MIYKDRRPIGRPGETHAALAETWLHGHPFVRAVGANDDDAGVLGLDIASQERQSSAVRREDRPRVALRPGHDGSGLARRRVTDIDVATRRVSDETVAGWDDSWEPTLQSADDESTGGERKDEQGEEDDRDK